MKKHTALLLALLSLAACTHTQVQVNNPADDRMTCTEIASQTAEVRTVLRDIDSKTGFSGRNVGLGLVFWPGIIVNQMNAGDARKAANDRLGILTQLSKDKECT
jgi:hypothetical protein